MSRGDGSQERFTDTSKQDVRPANDTAGHPTIEPHTVCFLASGLVITKLVDGTGYLVCLLHAGAVPPYLKQVSGYLPLVPTHICGKRTIFGYFSKLHRSRTHVLTSLMRVRYARMPPPARWIMSDKGLAFYDVMLCSDYLRSEVTTKLRFFCRHSNVVVLL